MKSDQEMKIEKHLIFEGRKVNRIPPCCIKQIFHLNQAYSFFISYISNPDNTQDVYQNYQIYNL